MVTITTFKISASRTEATIRGYYVSDEWTLVGTIDYPAKEIYGSRYYEGFITSWMQAYKLFDDDTNNMYVLMLCTSAMQPNQNSYWDQKRWNNQQMRVSMYPETEDTSIVSLVKYAPKATINSIEEIYGSAISLGIEEDKLVFSLSYNHSLTMLTDEVTTKVVVGEYGTGNAPFNKVNLIYNFINYSSNTNINNVCCSHFEENTYAIFKIKNYDADKSYNFYIDNTNTFYRYGLFNSASVPGTYTAQFTI